jgi:integrase
MEKVDFLGSLKLRKTMKIKCSRRSFEPICAVSSVVEHFLDTQESSERSAPIIGAFSTVSNLQAEVPPNKVSNNGRFCRVETCIHRHIRSGELWFVGRQSGKVVWQRLRTHDLNAARASVAMLSSKTNGNTAIFLVVEGKEQPIPEAKPVLAHQPLPRVRQSLVPADAPVAQAKELPVAQPAPSGSTPSLDDFLTRWRRGKDGLKHTTEARLDDCLKMLRRYVDASRPVTAYKPQDIRDSLAKARADKINGRRRLKGQTINEAIWRLLHNAFALALEEQFIVRNPMESVDREKTTPINRTQLSWEDAERILEDVKQRTLESYLELKFMLLMGVGQAEAKQLIGGSIDWNENNVSFIRQKTGKQYHVPIYPWAKEFVQTELEPRLKGNGPVFDWRNPRKALETACRNLGLAIVDARSLRRTLIIHLIQQGVELRLIAKWQGHADARLILSRYGAYIDAEHEERELAKLNAAAAVLK